ncbi:hypothetical protein FS837_005095 [Tulasnella sp. UAMH 9824]|nr:hypothetical protein FS837_005095 [Tulasnella sp. UAMH 9824]
MSELSWFRIDDVHLWTYCDRVSNQVYDAHADTWGDSTLHSAVLSILVLKPSNLDILTGEFSTEQDHPSSQPKSETSRRINFERPFVTPPKVVVFLKAFHTGSGSSNRVKTYTSDVDAKGFNIHIDTWGDPILYSATAGRVAYPEDRDNICSGTVNTLDVRPWNKPSAQTFRSITFQGPPLFKKPNVFMALNYIDISAERNLRVRTFMEGPNETGFRWHIHSWDDTTLWAAGANYIAFA